MDFSKYGEIEMDYVEAGRELNRLDMVRNSCKYHINDLISDINELAELVDYECNISKYDVVTIGLDYNVDQIRQRLQSQNGKVLF